MKGSNCGLALELSNPFSQVKTATTSSTSAVFLPPFCSALLQIKDRVVQCIKPCLMSETPGFAFSPLLTAQWAS